jgi:prepilin-type N-terminal cleavage/methylation domain-containing protein
MRKQRGFTLIELLVVIAIIGLLSTLAVVALNNARMKARDARRVSDVKQIQTALELFYNDANSYPTTVSGGGSIINNTVTYMSIVPKNPGPKDYNVGICPDADVSYPYSITNGGTWPNITTYQITYCLGGTTGGITGPAIHTAYPGGIQ